MSARPPASVEVVTVGVDIGGTNTRVGVVDRDGNILGEDRHPSPETVSALIATVSTAIEKLGRGLGTDLRIGAVGVGAAGLVDREGTVCYAPNLPQLIGVPLRSAIGDAVGMATVVDNDANAAAWGEACHGAARGVRDALVVTLGTGIGGGILVNGSVYRGAHGFAAEIGHWQVDPDGARCACGQLGHWEAEASGTALGRLARERAGAGQAPGVLARAKGDVDAITGLHVGESAMAGEVDGQALLCDLAQQVAIGFAGLANVLDPELIVVSGGLVHLGDLLLDPIREEFRDRVEGAARRPPIPVVAGALGDGAGVIGAAALARELVL